jgi:hypothetical protein
MGGLHDIDPTFFFLLGSCYLFAFSLVYAPFSLYILTYPISYIIVSVSLLTKLE